MYDLYAKFETATLSNGLTVHCLDWPERTGTLFQFLIHSGGRHDLEGKEGTAHFMEHLISENGPIPLEELENFFYRNSGTRPGLGSTGPNNTRYGFLSSADQTQLSKSLYYFGSMLFGASLSKYVERERDVIVGEFNRAFPVQYEYDLNRRMRQAAFSNTFFRRFERVLGTRESIAGITQEDVQAFYDTHYTPANTSVIVVGELTLAGAIKALEDSPFGDGKTGVRSANIEPFLNIPHPTETLIDFNQGEYQKGLSSASYGSTAQLPGIFTRHQVGIVRQMISRELFRIVRLENAWTYDIGCNFASLGDFHELSIKCTSLKIEAADHIADVVNSCIDSLAGQTDLFQKVLSEEIVKRRFNDPNMKGACNSATSDVAMNGRVISLAEELTDIERIEMKDITPIIEHLTADRRWTLIGHP